MFYFNLFPDVQKILPSGQMTLVKDITKRYDILDKVLHDQKYFDVIELLEGESLESVAERIYGYPEYSWLILLCNRSYNPFFSNYKTDGEMTNYIKQKYSIDMFKPDHYETLQGKILDEVDTYYYHQAPYSLKEKDVIAISHDTIERKKNSNKRLIQVIKPLFLYQVTAEIEKVFNSSSSSS